MDVKFVMLKDREMNLTSTFKEIKVNSLETTSTLPISPKWDFEGAAQYNKTYRSIK